MDMFKMMKEAAAMRSKLSSMEKALRENVMDIESHGIRIRINAKAEILDIKISPDVLKQDQERIEKDLLKAIQESTKKAHEVMAVETKKITGGLKIPGLM